MRDVRDQLLVLCLFAAGAAACSQPSQAVDSGSGAAPNAASAASTPKAAPPSDVRAFTGAPTKLVWVQSDGSDPSAAGNRLVLMGLDTEDGKGERTILGAPASYVEAAASRRGAPASCFRRDRTGRPGGLPRQLGRHRTETDREGLRADGLGEPV